MNKPVKKTLIRWPKCSIIVATFNGEKVIQKTLESLLELDYPNEYEIIVVDDGSEDNTKTILNKFKNKKKIKLILFGKNKGVCKARNAAINASKNSIIVNMDHDCIASKEWLKQMVKEFDDKKVGMTSGFVIYGGTSTAFRKSVLDEVGNYDEEYRYYREDTDLAFKIIESGYEAKLVKSSFFHENSFKKPQGLKETIKYILNRLYLHQNDVLLYKKHPNKRCEEFLKIKYGFLVDPKSDLTAATGKWMGKERSLKLSSPRGIIFLQNKSPIHASIIILTGIGYVIGVKTSRLIGSLRFGKLLI